MKYTEEDIIELIQKGDTVRALEVVKENSKAEEHGDEATGGTAVKVKQTSEDKSEESESEATNSHSDDESKSEKESEKDNKNKPEENGKEEKPQEQKEQNEEKQEDKKPKKQPSVQQFLETQEFKDAKENIKINNLVLLYGEAGTGKSYICFNIAEQLKLKFYYAQAVTDDYKIFGYKTATGEFSGTQFYDFCINGGLFMFDEIDASDSNILVAINGAMSDGFVEFAGKGKVKLNSNCHFIACANTEGYGGNMKYVGRNALDAATLDRYSVQIRVDYSTEVEKAMVSDKTLVAFYDDFRRATNEQGIPLIVSYRGLKAIDKQMRLTDIPLKNILKYTLIKSLDKETVVSIISRMKASNNKYSEALRELVMEMKENY